MTAVLDRELQTYEKHRTDLLDQAEGRYVLIHNGDVVGVYDTQMDAVTEGYKRFGNVPFLTKKIGEEHEVMPIVLSVITI